MEIYYVITDSSDIFLGYSLTKRFTWLCSVVLGITNAVSPVAGWEIFGGWKSLFILIIGAIVFVAGIVATAFLMVYEHMLVQDSVVINPAVAFDINQVYSILVMLFAVVNSILKG